MLHNTSSETFNLISWNMLLDTTRTNKGIIRPQHERLPAHIETLRSFKGSLDVVGVQEASLENRINNGVALANSLDFPTNFFYRHNLPTHRWQRGGRGRQNEFIGMFGNLVTNAEPFDIGDNRLAIITTIGSTAVVNFHFRQGRENRQMRRYHAEAILDRVSDFKHVALEGDTNEGWEKPGRNTFRDAGFESALFTKFGEWPVTYPTPEYHEIMSSHLPEGDMRSSVSIDDISVKGLEVVDAGILPASPVELLPRHDNQGQPVDIPDAPSDHYAIWATLSAA